MLSMEFHGMYRPSHSTGVRQESHFTFGGISYLASVVSLGEILHLIMTLYAMLRTTRKTPLALNTQKKVMTVSQVPLQRTHTFLWLLPWRPVFRVLSLGLSQVLERKLPGPS